MKKFIIAVDNYIATQDEYKDYLREVLREVGAEAKDIALVPMTSPGVKVSEMETHALREELDSFYLPKLNEFSLDSVIFATGNTGCYAHKVTNRPAGIASARGMMRDCPITGRKLMLALSPMAPLREPTRKDDFMRDLRIAYSTFKGTYMEQAPMIVRKIRTAEDIYNLGEAIKASGNYCAYDIETTGLEPFEDWVVSIAFHFGEKDENGAGVVYYWVGYDQMLEKLPEYDDTVVAAFKELFLQSRKGINFVAHNRKFDDWMIKEWLKIEGKWSGSTIDTMDMKHEYDSRRPHGLKDAVSRFLMFNDYDGKIKKLVADIANRRKKILRDPLDFHILEKFGHTPTPTKTGHKWPEGVERKLAAYVCIDPDDLEQYNSYDALYTYMLFETLLDLIEKEGLGPSLYHKMRTRDAFFEDVQVRGARIDLETNAAMLKEADELFAQCHKELMEIVQDETFNYRSTAHISKYIYGDTAPIPAFNRDYLMRFYEETSVGEFCDAVEQELYGDIESVKQACRDGIFDADSARQVLKNSILTAMPSGNRAFNAEKALAFNLVGLGGLGYDPVNLTKKGNASCSRSSLTTLNNIKPHPFINLSLMCKKIDYIKTHFLEKVRKSVLADGFTHPNIEPTGTITFRGSSSGYYNAQNFIKEIQGQFIPRDGYMFVETDLKSAEVFTLAAFTEDEKLLEAINSEDIHRKMASFIFKKPMDEITSAERKAAKTAVFLTIYQGGEKALALQLGVTTTEAREIIKMLNEEIPGIEAYSKSQIDKASRPPYYVYTAFGSRMNTMDILSGDALIASHAQRQAGNMPIQGTAGQLTFYIIAEMREEIKRRGWDAHLIISVHDSMLFEVREEIVEEFVELLNATIEAEKPFPPIDKVRFKGDTTVGMHWGCKPDLRAALSASKPGEEFFRWDLLKPTDDDVDEDEV